MIGAIKTHMLALLEPWQGKGTVMCGTPAGRDEVSSSWPAGMPTPPVILTGGAIS
jgi:hypothetical protein